LPDEGICPFHVLKEIAEHPEIDHGISLQSCCCVARLTSCRSAASGAHLRFHLLHAHAARRLQRLLAGRV
jgi:hypothetical protein